MKLPTFLIIGGMKCGSTTLYRDLMTQPGVFFPIDKEPESLCDPDVLTEAGRERYAAMFEEAEDTDQRGEASTAYTKRPTHEGVAERARELLGPDLKLIYIVREPVARVKSHHSHETGLKNWHGSVAESIAKYPEMMNYTRYGMQARPWVEIFGRESVRIVRMDDYVKNRRDCTDRFARFIGVEPKPELVETDRVFNKSDGRPVPTHGWESVLHNPLYKRLVRPLLSTTVREKIREVILPKAKVTKEPLDEATVRRIYDELAEDHAELAGYMGIDGPVWDVEKAVAKHAAPPAASKADQEPA
ncbi:MAG: sulfotransferase domain-containing protein [Planctomycetota bacterium]